MASRLSFLVAICLHSLLVAAMVSNGRRGHGLIGYGITMYDPPCAFACRDTISGSPLNCSTEEMDMDGMDMGGASTEPECYATDDAFLQTLAWCISTHCQHVTAWKLEKFWRMNVAGHGAVQPDPKETYQQALAKVTKPPTEILVTGDPLNQTSLVTEDDWMANYNADSIFEIQEDTHERYGLVVFLSGVVIPIGFSVLRFVPWPARLTTKFNAHIIYPPAFGSHHKEAILGVNIPTRGQALFILYLIAINVILCSVGYSSKQPNGWYLSTYDEIKTYITNRTGVLSFANVPLLILYAGRNNVLLWLTNWSHGTFLLLHRWVAWICTIEAVIHSCIYLQVYVASGEHSIESKMPYWIWGAIATLGMSILLPTSILPLRQKLYEVFLLWHIVISILIVAGCYLHINYRFGHQWGYEVWIYVAMAVWAFERTMRVGRFARNGLCTATVTVIDNDYLRVDVEGVSGNGHAYLYFPTLTWRVWENHPFSVASTVLPASTPQTGSTNPHGALTSDVEKHPIQASRSQTSQDSLELHHKKGTGHSAIGLTFLLRTRGGLTAQLRSLSTLPVLVESQYGLHEDLSSHSILIAIAGGVGITAVLPLLRAHPGNRKLFWGARTQGLVSEMDDVLADVEKEVFVGERMNVATVLDNELEVIGDFAKESVVVVVSGPPGMADEVRFAVARLGKEMDVKLTFVEESFSW
ncbi:ferric reductase-like protein transmembrane component 4 [Lophium mytilinum]|uniref:Ferric reductase-like protein transmembrane component 4 n=1 Tax=Lophium mytilinum TaxID=390894 RepID=A0A6A6QM04_9PEZI|nr:ferric reductase-like protein transmembrane component 4 [Lophium mytilinum]